MSPLQWVGDATRYHSGLRLPLGRELLSSKGDACPAECHGGACFPPLLCLLMLQGWEPLCCSREAAPSPTATLPLLLLLLLKPGQSVLALILPRPGWAALEVFLCLELAGDYVWGGGWISWPPGWDLQLWRLFSSPRAGAQSPSLLPPGKWRRATAPLCV